MASRLVTHLAVGANEVEIQQVKRNGIGGDRHEDGSHRAFADGRIALLGIDPYENGPAVSHEIARFLTKCGRRPHANIEIS
jgi:hypothetical protein